MTAQRLGSPIRLAVAAALVPLAFSGPARSSEFVLVWDAPAECPSADVVKKQVVKRLGSQHAGLALKAHATVTHEASVFRVRLHTYRAGQRGLRTLDAPTCSELVDAIAVIVALAVDSEPAPDASSGEIPGNTVGKPAPQPAPAPSDSSPDSANPNAVSALGPNAADPSRAAPSSRENPRGGKPPASTSETPSAESGSKPPDPNAPIDDPEAEAGGRAFTDLGLQGVASLAGAVEAGILPGLGFGVTFRGGMRFRRIRVEGALSRWFARQAQSSVPGRGADVDGMAIAAWSCFRAVPGHTAPVPRLRSALPPDDAPPIEAGPCLGFEVGELQARSFGVTDERSGSGAYAALGGGLRLGATAADWLSLDVRFEGFRVLHRPEFRVENLGVVYEPELWSLRVALGAEAYFP